MELVYPIYLDVPMMTGFLASLEDGIIEEAELENRTGDSKEKSGSAAGKVASSGLLRGLLEVGGGLEAAKKVAESVESSYKGVVRYPTSALFIRLRRLLLESNGQVKTLTDEVDLHDINTGDIIEFDGIVRANPTHQIQTSIQQLFPVLSTAIKKTEADLEVEKATVRAAANGSTVLVQQEDRTIHNKKEKEELLAAIENKQNEIRTQFQLYDTIGEVIAGLLRQDIWNTIIIETGKYKAICRIYPNFIRNERVEELHDANWTCMGKVIGKVQLGETFDLLKGIPIGYFAKGVFKDITKALNTEALKIEIGESEVKGPAIIIAVMALYS